MERRSKCKNSADMRMPQDFFIGFSNLNPPLWEQNQKVCQNQKVKGKIELYQRQRLHR